METSTEYCWSWENCDNEMCNSKETNNQKLKLDKNLEMFEEKEITAKIVGKSEQETENIDFTSENTRFSKWDHFDTHLWSNRMWLRSQVHEF